MNPNNPTGAVYPRPVLEAIARLAERQGLVVLSDEIYDQVLYDEAVFRPMATLVRDTVCVSMSGLSKVYRAQAIASAAPFFPSMAPSFRRLSPLLTCMIGLDISGRRLIICRRSYTSSSGPSHPVFLPGDDSYVIQWYNRC